MLVSQHLVIRCRSHLVRDRMAVTLFGETTKFLQCRQWLEINRRNTRIRSPCFGKTVTLKVHIVAVCGCFSWGFLAGSTFLTSYWSTRLASLLDSLHCLPSGFINSLTVSLGNQGSKMENGLTGAQTHNQRLKRALFSLCKLLALHNLGFACFLLPHLLLSTFPVPFKDALSNDQFVRKNFLPVEPPRRALLPLSSKRTQVRFESLLPRREGCKGCDSWREKVNHFAIAPLCISSQ
jgi:hypothetical protein